MVPVAVPNYPTACISRQWHHVRSTNALRFSCISRLALQRTSAYDRFASALIHSTVTSCLLAQTDALMLALNSTSTHKTNPKLMESKTATLITMGACLILGTKIS